MTWLRALGTVAVASVVWWATSHESTPMTRSEAEAMVWEATNPDRVCQSFDRGHINATGIDSRGGHSQYFAARVRNETAYSGTYFQEEAWAFLDAQCLFRARG